MIAVIEGANLTVSIAERRLFSNVSLRIVPGEVVGLVGPNGVGKTTLLNVFSGFLRSDSGCASLYGGEIQKFSPAQIALSGKGVSRSFQIPFLQDGFGVLQNILLGSRIAQAAGHSKSSFEGRARDVIDALNIVSFQGSIVGELSVGQRRKIELARVFASGAGVVLLDEPFANLDIDGIDRVGALLRRSAKDGAATLLVEHRPDAISAYCDRSIQLGGTQ